MGSDDEFPCLTDLGLYALSIPGDGNCLFSALSDQIYGSTNQNAEIRAKTIQHIQENKNYYIQFIDVIPGGGTRRQPKRKTAANYSFNAPTPDETERAFQNYVREMAKGGTYGDNMEVAAFSACFNVNVRIYQANSSYVVASPGQQQLSARTTAHIAYHASYLHYSSVRNVHGPHSGLPEVNVPMADEPRQDFSYPPPAQAHPAWMIKAVMQSLSYSVDENTAGQALSLNNNSIDDAVTYLFDQDTSTGTPDIHSVQSSSVERELGSDEEDRDGPQKRQDRRLSRARKERQRAALRGKMATFKADSLESLLTAASSSRNETDDSGDDAMSSPPPLNDGSTSPDSDYSPPFETIPKPAPKITIKLSKPPESSQSSQPPYPTKLVLKHNSPKRLAARDAKTLKKHAQKQARKERGQKQAAGSHKTGSFTAGPAESSQSSFGSQPAVTNGFRTMHI